MAEQVRRLSRWLLIVALSVVGGYSGRAADPVPVIFDTDITGDVDDVLALAMLHTLADRGACEILAVTISKEHPLAAPWVDAVNTFYGRPDIPIGVPDGAPPRDSKYLQLAEATNADGSLRYPRDVGIEGGQATEDAVALIRRVLAAAEDRSVAVIQVGLAVNVAALLESGGDEHSPLAGPELVGAKVDHLSLMAGAFTTIRDNNHYLEANVRNHVVSMQVLADRWPNETPAIWSGFAIGVASPYPRRSIAEDFDYVAHHPVKEAYLLHSGPDHDRPTWDLTSVLYSVWPDRGYFDLSARGRVTVEHDGFTRFTLGETAEWVPKVQLGEGPGATRDRFLKMSPAQAARVQEALVHLVVQPPKDLEFSDPSQP